MCYLNLQVDDIVSVMRDNVTKVLERDHKLGELEQRADNLHDASVNFAKSSNK